MRTHADHHTYTHSGHVPKIQIHILTVCPCTCNVPSFAPGVHCPTGRVKCSNDRVARLLARWYTRDKSGSNFRLRTEEAAAANAELRALKLLGPTQTIKKHMNTRGAKAIRAELERLRLTSQHPERDDWYLGMEA